MVPEKFDVVGLSHKVEVEYGNVGVDFKFVPREGFGWMNASYQLGLAYLNTQMRRALGTCTDPDLLFERALMRERQGNKLSAEDEEALRRRRSSQLAARALTRNGSVSAAVTRIGSFDNTATTGEDVSPTSSSSLATSLNGPARSVSTSSSS